VKRDDASSWMDLNLNLNQNNKHYDGLSSAHPGEWRKHLKDVMTVLKSLTIVAVVFAGGTSLATAQNGLPTGGEHPVAGITTTGLIIGIGITNQAARPS
jgi:hypothetical protein